MPADSMPDVTMKIDERGQVVSVESGGRSLPMGLGGGLDLSSFANQTGLVFPDTGSAKPGDEWTATFTYPIPGMGQDVGATFRGETALRLRRGRPHAGQGGVLGRRPPRRRPWTWRP